MPSQPPVDRRNNNNELSEQEIQARIAKRDEARRRARIQTWTGLGLGGVGTVVAAYAGLVTGAIWMTVLGFVVALIGFGFINVKEAGDIAKGLIGRGGKD
jgi:hypothetical protein